MSQRVAQLRGTVPSQLAQQLTQHLHSCRPALIPAEDSEAATTDTLAAAHDSAPKMESGSSQGDVAAGGQSMVPVAASDEVQNDPLSPTPAALQSLCKAAVQRMPALRYAVSLLLAKMQFLSCLHIIA